MVESVNGLILYFYFSVNFQLKNLLKIENLFCMPGVTTSIRAHA